MNYKDQVSNVTLRGKEISTIEEGDRDLLCRECCKWLRKGDSVGHYLYTYLLHNFPVYEDENGDEAATIYHVCMDCYDPHAVCYPRPEYGEK